jgi:hypothetical protein
MGQSTASAVNFVFGKFSSRYWDVHLPYTGQSLTGSVRIKGLSVHFAEYSSGVRSGRRAMALQAGMLVT